ncbi:putative xenobiotic-transporting ATPase [Rosa chinensis]|uniref:Putative xenobiotic-transporting ATPase n=1 Tax=Rosa chinensis TaxID=74649 RepID=A0A2P6SPJ7_ROSCH|nr:putative xenobiotic-transporting ATPase [Rosa chinensis]
MSFWRLNEKTIRSQEDEDILKLRDEDRAESCHGKFLEQLRKQKQIEPSSQSSVLKTIILFHWKEISLSGLFALLKILTTSAGPLLLNAFIRVAKGNESSEHEGSGTSAIDNKQLRLSNAAKLTHSGCQIMNELCYCGCLGLESFHFGSIRLGLLASSPVFLW